MSTLCWRLWFLWGCITLCGRTELADENGYPGIGLRLHLLSTTGCSLHLPLSTSQGKTFSFFSSMMMIIPDEKFPVIFPPFGFWWAVNLDVVFDLINVLHSLYVILLPWKMFRFEVKIDAESFQNIFLHV